MKKTKVVAVTFGKSFKRLTKAFINSAEYNLAKGTDLIVIDGKKPKPMFLGKKRISTRYTFNSYKLHLWRDFLNNNKDDNVIFMDVDMVVLKDLTVGFEKGDFDIGITKRPGRLWYNGGVVFVRPNKRSRAFFDRWVEKNDYFLNNPAELQKANETHWGLNQTALVHLLGRLNQEDTEYHKPFFFGNNGELCKFYVFDCQTWNCCDTNWRHFDKDTARALHIKGGLRDLITSYAKSQQYPPFLRAAAREFFRYDLGE